ncbi:M23 family metallopeptidase [Phyllobacterium sp. 21LDTY02-6]|uniref:M23 family metallopeptidase n=1 Tax=unclassified Phyllobacterium TaxID=2638441 RepID=UPI0020216A24|nr:MULTISPECIES: M23 family metallopeptidase [unclassified Phyllobacterium]MCO4319194.1 M23 family metallopeptidase [Phyllobacterium sp. 21LDTY02-6]MCX8280043.1 M23 family metallopeptidase [Phyllobacterium sp. 0TCS1.6C]MCX8296210.1 M23 family metallopeptidase [Phyllobacterium sp. 0TCS1.6A]
MNEYEGQSLIDPGNEPPLITDGRRGPPDRREISARWLAGTFLTGITSSVLMGVALFAALDGREQLATPPEIMARNAMPGASSGDVTKGPRVAATVPIQKNRDRRRLDVSTMFKEGERDVVRTMPFELVRISLADVHNSNRRYPPFNPLNVFAEANTGQNPAPRTGLIYGAKVESEVSLRTVEFPIASAQYDPSDDLSVDEVEQVVRNTGSLLSDGAIQVASLHYVDPLRFGSDEDPYNLRSPLAVKIIQENVSVSPRLTEDAEGAGYSEELIPFRSDKNVLAALNDSGYENSDATGMSDAIAKLLNSPRLKAGSVLRLGVESRNGIDQIIRASVYNRTTHVLTIALNDRGQYVPADEPEVTPGLQLAFDDSPPLMRRADDLPSVYDGIYRAGIAYGMTDTMIQQLIRMLASDVDFQARLSPSDKLEALFSLPEGSDKADSQSEILYVSANFSGETRRFYRFHNDDGTTDYYDENGKSSKQFLIRKPVPNGVFRSPFGMRRHPILGYSRMHTGVDWSAPRGTPIIASGNGVVERAGWTNGYGNQTIIRHSNGYESSYSHQNAIASGVTPGSKVRQGQVIGYVGSTGLSTGPHLHYEVIVNGSKVDPMRIRLPSGGELRGDDLLAFKRERERIDQLLLDDGSPTTKVAASG